MYSPASTFRERTAAYDREQRDRQALLDCEDRQRQLTIDGEDRQRERERSDQLELADQPARAAALEQQLQHLQDTAAQLPPPPSTTIPAPVISTQPGMPPAVTVVQLVDTSVPSTPLPTHTGLHSLTGIATSAAAYPTRSALQRAADFMISCRRCLDWVPRGVPMLPFASASTAVTSLKPALERATAFYDRLPSVPEYPVRLHTAQSSTPHVPPLTTLPTFTTPTPRSAVLPLSGTGGTPPSAPPPPLASGYVPHTAALPWSVAQHHISPPAPHTQWSTMDLPQSYIHVPPTLQITADVHALYSAPATTDCTTTVPTPLPAPSTLVQPTPAATPAVVAPTATVSAPTAATDILPTPVTLTLDTVVPAPTQCTLPMVLPTAPALATAGATALPTLVVKQPQLPKPYNGLTSWKSLKERFRRICRINGWTAATEQVQYLSLSLDGPAADLLNDVDESSATAHEDIWRLLSDAMDRLTHRAMQCDVSTLVDS